MKNIDELLKSVEEQKRMAEEAQKKAQKAIKEAEKQLEDVKKAKKILDEADMLNKQAEAKRQEANKYYPIDADNGKNKNKKNGKNNGIIKGIAIGVAGSLVAGGLAYVLIRESKTGNLIPNKETNLGSLTSLSQMLEEENKEHTVLTDSNFDKLAAGVVMELEKLGLDLSRENITKYVMLVNIDQLAEENPELIKTIVGEQSVDEVMMDFLNVIGARADVIRKAYNNGRDITNLFRISNVVFDEEQKAMTKEVETRLTEVIKAADEPSEFNRLLKPLLLDLWTSKSNIYSMESGVGYNLQVILKPLRTIYGDVLNIIDEDNMNILVRLVSNASDKQEDKENCMAGGYYREMYMHLNGVCETLVDTNNNHYSR